MRKHYGAPKRGICYMQFMANDIIVDHRRFLDVYVSHRDLEFTDKESVLRV